MTIVAGLTEVSWGTVADAAELQFNEVFRNYSSYVAAIGFRILGRHDEVEDLVQDVFLQVYRGLRAMRDPAALRGWLATITVRTARRRLDARRVRTWLHIDRAPDYLNVADPGASPEDAALLAAVYRTLDRLPTEQRIAWALRHIEGERLDRVALLVGCSLATAKRRISAAHEAIKREVCGG